MLRNINPLSHFHHDKVTENSRGFFTNSNAQFHEFTSSIVMQTVTQRRKILMPWLSMGGEAENCTYAWLLVSFWQLSVTPFYQKLQGEVDSH